jgi:hypothetical protein
MRYSAVAIKKFIKSKPALSGAVFLVLLLSAPSARASLFDRPIDFGGLSYNSIVNDVMKNRCPFGDAKSYADYYNACVNPNNVNSSCVPMTKWLKSDNGYVPIEGVVVSTATANKFYPNTCYQTDFQNPVAITATPTVEGASIEAPQTQQVQAVTGANDVSFSIIAATSAAIVGLISFYLILVNFNWFTRTRLYVYSRYKRLLK